MAKYKISSQIRSYIDGHGPHELVWCLYKAVPTIKWFCSCEKTEWEHVASFDSKEKAEYAIEHVNRPDIFI